MAQLVEPHTPEELARVLADAARARQSTVIRGGGTKRGWARPVPEADLTVRTSRLNQLIVHRHGDMTASVQSGMRLLDLNATLATHRQWLPVESAFPDATIGGIIATNDCGPMRHRSGTPRDLLIGITLALTDGRLVKAGGHVVKNVAGYDLGRLISGSFGSYAAIVDATFKLMPIPQASATLVATYDTAAALARDAAALMASQLEPAALDVRSGRLQAAPGVRSGRLQPAHDSGATSAPQMLVRFASSPASTSEQMNHAAALLTGAVTSVTGPPEFDLWAEQLQAPWRGGATVVRLSWLPSMLPDVMALTGDHPFRGRLMGTGMVRLDGDSGTHAAFIERLRSSTAVRHVVVLQAPDALKQQVDVWGPPPSSIAATRALKQMFDPAGILGAGGPV